MAVRCVVIDDNDRFLDAAKEALERDGIVVAGVACDAVEGMDLTMRIRPDVVLVDVCLGEESGFVLAERLARANVTWRLTIILLSTYSKYDFADMLQSSPAHGFLSKTDLSGLAVCNLVQNGNGGPVKLVSARRERR
jgi:DNA-binding NarL/FixJ family response regulator